MNPNPNTMQNILSEYQTHIQQQLQHWLPAKDSIPKQLHEAIHYAVFNGGKRLRPCLVYLTGGCFGADIETLDYPAMAVELLHCYTLVHDDLPAMDNDDLRRGKPSCHKAFDEATAILVGDALQGLAFEILACERDAPSRQLQLQMIKTLANANTPAGVVGGQSLDLLAENQTPTLPELSLIYELKTSALLKACVHLGALSAGCADTDILQSLDQFANCMGLVFQIQDDILDIEGTPEVIGKQTGADAKQGKTTIPMLIGVTEAKQHLQQFIEQAMQALIDIPDNTKPLQDLLFYMAHRDH